jgi:DNA helicase-2/ATP-dependent DNA helicase PcrA
MHAHAAQTAPAVSVTPNAGSFSKGSAVFHQKFGNGVVLGVDGDHLTIAFKHAGQKKVMADYVSKT